MSKVANLTERQRDVYPLLAAGTANKRIAYDLGISLSTTKVHVSKIMRALGVTNRVQAAITLIGSHLS